MRIVVLLLFLSTCFALRAQINAGHPEDNEFHIFEGGIVAGINMSQVHGDYLAGFNKLGLNGGPELHINITRSWFVSLEMLFTQKGSRSTPTSNAGFTYDLRLNYVELPAMINYNDRNRLIFQAGLAYGRLYQVTEVINGTDFDNDENFFNDELSYVLGGTILIGEKKHFGANIRYQASITSVGVPFDPDAVGMVNALLSLRGVYYF